MLEQIKKVVANGNQSGVVNSKIAVFKKKAVIANITFDVDAEDKTALFNILPLYWLVEHPENGIHRVGNCPETTIDAQGAVVIEGTKEAGLSTEDCYLVIANWPDNMAITTSGIERVI